ncbi:uncharacterized protein fam113 [Heptranchias perlo]|uniref:uncharacterized protein fam113 n=1 Tax=Heptranchias perlo TaxID=212740 RepID=UPI00355AA63A
MAMPLGEKLRGGFLIPELQYLDSTLRGDVIEANFYSAVLANDHGFDVLDLHYHFRFELKHRAQDGIHWNKVVHRSITNMLLAHIAEAWGVTLSPKTVQAPLCLDLMPRGRPVAASGVCVPFCHRGTPESHNSNTVETDFIRDFTETRFGAPCPGYTSFHINPTSNTDPAPYRADLAPPQADRRYRGPARTGGSSDGYWGLRSNDLVMRWRLHRWIPAPYSRLPHDRLGHY